jgi:hypothetical protein
MDVGDFVSADVAGKVAQKNGDGYVIRGKWITYRRGDIGRIINKRPVGTEWLYKVSFPGGVVELYSRHLSQMGDEDIAVDRNKMAVLAADRVVSKSDKKCHGNAEY